MISRCVEEPGNDENDEDDEQYCSDDNQASDDDSGSDLEPFTLQDTEQCTFEGSGDTRYDLRQRAIITRGHTV